ncbi:MAG: hypothetical protein M3O36_20045, partial [Myxococcota bacterium]|nr:hypothetical protein [Myxococcota bacterium]
GGAGLIAGAVAGMVAAGQHSGLANACTPKCLPDRRKDLDAYHTVATIADVGFAVAGAGMAAGIVLLLTQPTPHAEGNQGGANGASGGTGLRLTPVLGPGSVGAVVQF